MKRTEGLVLLSENLPMEIVISFNGFYIFFLRSASPCTDILALRQKWRRLPIFFPLPFFGLNECFAYPDIQIILSHDYILHFELFVELFENKQNVLPGA